MDPSLGLILQEKASRRVYTVGPEATVARAVALMAERQIGCLLVTRERRLVGIFTERDLLMRVVRRSLPTWSVTVSQVMTPDPLTVLPTMTLRRALRFCAEHRIRHLPVAERGRLLGLLSLGDLAQRAARVDEDRDPLDQLMRSIYGRGHGAQV